MDYSHSVPIRSLQYLPDSNSVAISTSSSTNSLVIVDVRNKRKSYNFNVSKVPNVSCFYFAINSRKARPLCPSLSVLSYMIRVSGSGMAFSSSRSGMTSEISLLGQMYRTTSKMWGNVEVLPICLIPSLSGKAFLGSGVTFLVHTVVRPLRQH